ARTLSFAQSRLHVSLSLQARLRHNAIDLARKEIYHGVVLNFNLESPFFRFNPNRSLGLAWILIS
ncbi:hypothetical protein, partial [Prevotella pectinovora]|uniref:hypothetical protein n=1 Tax=Prevotella pectinovora TaxID=1602169 RepID=UPI00307AAD2B